MNLIFTKVRYKNILSTGSTFTEIDLNTHKTNLILGHNGAGKTTILDAIAFCLYNKPFRKVTQGQLINSVNQKGLLTEVEFTIGDSDYMVRRGLKPKVFEIYRNGELLDKKVIQQAYLEENILKMSFKVFGKIVVLGNTKYKAFMDLDAKERREFNESVLDMQVFSRMNLVLKERVEKNKTRVIDIEHKADLLKTEISSAKSHNESIRKVHDNNLQKIKERVEGFIQKRKDALAEIKELDSDIFDLQEKIVDKKTVQSRLERLRDAKSKLLAGERTHSEPVVFFENHDDCPTCKQAIDNSHKSAIIQSHSEKLNLIRNDMSLCDEKISECNTRLHEISEVEREISGKQLKKQDNLSLVRMAEDSLKALKKEAMDTKKEIEEISEETIAEKEAELRSVNSLLTELYKEKERFKVVATLLKDTGIKSYIVKQYIPMMNQILNGYLNEMGLPINFSFDENFNETILSRFRDDFSYSSFSEGEKLRIDLALLFTWRDISKMRNPVTTNLLIMDEILDSSLDDSGNQEFLNIIKRFSEGTNLFIISHRGESLRDSFDNVIEFKKKNGFSRPIEE